MSRSMALRNLGVTVVIIAVGIGFLALMRSFTPVQQNPGRETPAIRPGTVVRQDATAFPTKVSTATGTVSSEVTPDPTPTRMPEGTPSSEAVPSPSPTPGIRLSVQVGDDVPEEIRRAVAFVIGQSPDAIGLTDSGPADLTVTTHPGEDAALLAVRVYVPVVRFPTLRDEVTLDELTALWQGREDANLYLTEETLTALVALWEPPAPEANVQIVAADELVDRLWQDTDGIAIIPFDRLEPRLKVLSLDGESGTDNRLSLGDNGVLTDWPLTLRVFIAGPEEPRDDLRDALLTLLPQSNRDPERLTTLVMTGVTAMARLTAVRIEAYGDYAYPAHAIGQVLSAADITHISNEIPFVPDCVADGSENNLILCSKPEYFAALEEVGMDIVGLSGNHMADFGEEMFLWSLDYYRQKSIPYYAGGEDAEEATRPLTITHNQNGFAFLGANQWGPPENWATDERPGSARYDAEGMVSTIRALKESGQTEIVSVELQWEEAYQVDPLPDQVTAFRALAEAGADIVTGVQSHVAQAIEFHAGGIILYGLGNLFFDQMWSTETRQAIIARHSFYDGRHISTDLLVTVLEDYAQPRWATEGEREEVLSRVFEASGWVMGEQER